VAARHSAKVFSEVPAGSQWDWRFSDFLVKAGVAIYVLRDSLVQHILPDGHTTPRLRRLWR
jgi:hypothetical protein